MSTATADEQATDRLSPPGSCVASSIETPSNIACEEPPSSASSIVHSEKDCDQESRSGMSEDFTITNCSLKPTNETLPSVPFHPPKTYKFPVNASRSCHSEWFSNWPWLHYDVSLDAVFCFVCMTAEAKKISTSSRREMTFIDGFKNWKKATEKFRCHEKSEGHSSAQEKIRNLTKPTIKMTLSAQCAKSQEMARKCLTVIFSSVRYLCAQGFPIRGHEHKDGPLYNLVTERSTDVPELLTWLQKRDTWLSDTVQNEIIEMMAHAIQQEILAKLKDSEFVGIIADGTTDCAGDEQFSICLQFFNNKFETENCFVGLYNVPDSSGSTLTSAVKDVLLRFNVPLTKLQGLSVDGASNMSGKNKGVQSLIKKEYPGVLYVHCCNHSLDLVLQEASRQSRGFADALLFVKNVANLLRRSSKRKSIFSSMFGDDEKVITLSSICPTRWCVRRTAVKKVLLSYNEILKTLEQIKADKNYRGEVQSTAAGLLTQAKKARTFFFLLCVKEVFGVCEDVATILQHEKLTAKAALENVEMLKRTIQSFRDDKKFDELKIKTEEKTAEFELKITEKRQYTTPARIRHDNQISIEEKRSDSQQWKIEFFEALDFILVQLDTRFDQEDLVIAAAREDLLSNVNAPDFEASKLPKSFDLERLHRQLLQLHDLCTSENETLTVSVVTKLLLSLNPLSQSLFSEIIRLLALIQCQPISAASCERSFSCLRRLKTWLRSTMTQKRLSHVALLTSHRDKLAQLDLNSMINDFCRRNRERVSVFG
jgi:hypothetical protein